jgi:hypothetical protein
MPKFTANKKKTTSMKLNQAKKTNGVSGHWISNDQNIKEQSWYINKQL